MKKNTFDLEWQLLLKEIEINKSSIAQMHEFGKSIKNWTILLWSMTVGGALTNSVFHKYIILIVAIPLLFWFVEYCYRKIQSQFLYRMEEIKEFVNSENLSESKEKGFFSNFKTLYLLGEKRESKSYIEKTRWRKIFFYKSCYIFYGSLSLFTIFIWILVNYTN